MALWPMVSDDESWSKEWIRVRAHISESFRLLDTAMELSYVDDDRDEITLYALMFFVLALLVLNVSQRATARCWKNFLTLVNRGKTKIRSIYVYPVSQLIPYPSNYLSLIFTSFLLSTEPEGC